MKIITLLIIVFCALSSYAQTNLTNHIIVIDNTGSMRGKPEGSGNLNIWNDVKKEIIKYISTIEFGNKITLYNFDENLSKAERIAINSADDLKQATKYVNNLSAIGLTTCLYTALYNTLIDIQQDSNERKLIYIFTDFVEACPDENYTIEDIKNEFNIVKSKDYAHLYYISLGKSIPQDIRELADKDDDVTATFKTPGKEDLFPEINVDSKSISVDFLKERIVEISIPISFTNNLKSTNLKVKLNCENDKINLLTKNIEILSENIVLKFQIDDSYYSNNNESGSIIFNTNSQVKWQNNEIQINFILPKKRKSTITIE